MATKKGFTLIELLVVIAIIALLLAILLPSLGKAKRLAQFVICKTNLNQYALAMGMYLNDYEDIYPSAWGNLNKTGSYADGRPEGCRWHDEEYAPGSDPKLEGTFWPYVDARKTHLCPTFLRVSKTKGESHPGHRKSIPVVPQYSYSMNGWIGVRDSNPNKIKKTMVRNPSRKFLFSEENMWYSDTNNGYDAQYSRFVLNDTALLVGTVGGTPVDCFGSFHKVRGSDYTTGVVNALMVDSSIITVHHKESTVMGPPK